MLRLQRDDQLLDLLPLGVLVRRTDVVDDRQLIALGKVRDGLLADVEHGPDLRDAGAAEVGHGLKAADAALVEKAHKEGLDRVVKVVAEGDLVAAKRKQHVVERAAAHLRAHRAGVPFVPVVEDDGADLGLFDLIRHLQLLAQRRHRREIHPRQPHVDRDGLQLVMRRIVPPQRGQQI